MRGWCYSTPGRDRHHHNGAIRTLIAAFVATRLALVCVVWLAVSTMQLGCRNEIACPHGSMDLLGGFTRWDADAYLDIARNGYLGAGRESFGAYSPLYPLLVRAAGLAFGGSDAAFAISGIVIANVALIVALAGVYALSRPRIGDAGAVRVGTLLLIFPTTIFLSAAYAEPLFIATSVWSAREAEDARWLRAGGLAALAAFTRPFGAISVVPLIFAARRHGPSATAIVAIALAPLAFVAWTVYLWSISGDPLNVVHVYGAWGSGVRSPLATLGDLFDPTVYGFPWIVLGLFALFVVLVAIVWRRWGWGYGVYGAGLLLVVAASGSITSSMRYELAIYPAFIALAAITNRAPARIAWSVVSFVLALVFAGMFALYYWVG